MTLAWKGENDLMLKNPVKKGAAYKCDCCPCYSGGWYIATVCPCLNCGHAGPSLIGDSIPQGNAFVTFDYGPNSEMVTLKCLTMYRLIPRDSNNDPDHPTDSVNHWQCLTLPTKSILYAVRHKTIPAPFSGSVGAKLYLNGALIGGSPDWTFGPQECEENDEVEIGYALDTSAPPESPVIAVPVVEKFTSDGLNNVDLVITFHSDDEGVEDVVYSCRTSIRVIDPGEEFSGETKPWIGAIGVVPEYTGLDTYECVVEGEDPASGTTVGMFYHVLKGPFATKADAEAVLLEFNGFIHAYAASCNVCDQGPCDVGDTFGIEYVVGTTGWCEIEEYGSTSDRGPGPKSCEYSWTKWWDWEITLQEGAPFEVKVVKENYDGTSYEIPYDEVPTDGVLPPCSGGYHVYVRKTDPEFDWANISYWLQIGGNDDYLNDAIPCVVNDDESPYYEWLWDYEHEGDPEHPSEYVEGQTGVPNSTLEWLDYLCWKNNGGYYIDGECLNH